MKRLFTYVLFSVLTIASISANAQTANDTPYLKNPYVPEFTILKLDSATFFNTRNIKAGKPVLLIMFMPDCWHCEEMTDSMLLHMDELKKFQIYMVAPSPLYLIKEFYEKKKLSKYKNLIVGKDYDLFFPAFYKAYEVPYKALYDKNKKLVKTFGQNAHFDEVLKAAKKL